MQGIKTSPRFDEASNAVSAFAVARSKAEGDPQQVVSPPTRLDLDSKTVQHDLARLVLSLVEVIRQLMERQAMRRIEGGSLAEDQIEAVGLTLMRLEERMDELKEHFGVTGDELKLDLGRLIEDF